MHPEVKPDPAAPAPCVLGIETSCDETAVAIYRRGSGLLAHALFSQADLHAEFGGVVPELASRDHVRKLLPLLDTALRQAGLAPSQLDAIAYTAGPGLVGALLVGAATAVALGRSLQRPVVGVHHLEAHLLAPRLERQPPAYPFLALLVSGGHTMLVRVAGLGRYSVLGETLDDAAGEAFDKTARLLELPHASGAALAALAQQGDPQRYPLPRPLLGQQRLDFSFSGLKTAVRLTVEREAAQPGGAWRADLAASFQQAVVDVLVAKVRAALHASGLTRLVVAGGVGANVALRAALRAEAGREGWQLYYPRIEFCTDNGAMVALAGAERIAEAAPGAVIGVRARWPLSTLAPPAARPRD
ncbi:MAG TPA: tRNA (adenosine(37)-N6)-threonylcarbamoyltransferase complex transferase subunit TsaD [Gammaproteobacteria bacterium]|nr:tRNA (adenosine(37)-N6)-threonylcarbamoyltransferase complex transferase subunit TsaD [Gammaproteobacteria bacterium]